tara:strand:- start:96 stop:287 length:192 start_codon:yes stop_codon:yes gene_type:complete
MKKFIKKSYGILISVGLLFMIAGRYYPDETATDNNIAAGIYIVAAVFFFLAAISGILSLSKEK